MHNNEAQPNINTEQTSDTHIPESEYITNVTPQSTMVENTQQPFRQKAFVIYTNVKEELCKVCTISFERPEASP